MKKYTFIGALAAALCLSLCGVAAGQTAPAKPAASKAAAAKKTPAKPAKAAKAKTPPVPTLIWRGDRATERAFVADLAKQYEVSKLGKITMQPFSTVSGIDAVHEGSADIAGSARPAMPERIQETGLTFYPVAWDALVPITSLANPVDNITLLQLHQIYLGYATNWKDVNGPDKDINLYSIAAPLDGVEDAMSQLLFHNPDQPLFAPRKYLNTAKLEEGVTLDPRSLGITTYSAVYDNTKLKMLRLEGVPASTATIADGSYPLYVPLYLAARDDGKNHEAVDKFIKFANSDAGKAVIRKHKLIPYDDAPDLIAKKDARIAFIDAQVGAPPTPRVAAAPTPTPVSAPIATADFLARTQPTSPEAQEAKQRAAQVQADAKTANKAPDNSHGN